MYGINKAIILGYLGKDPGITYLPDGKCKATFYVATNESWKMKDTNEKKEATEWHRVTCFGKLAEICSDYLTRGKQVYIEGRIHTDKWKDKETGQDKYSTGIIGERMRLLGSASQSNDTSKLEQEVERDSLEEIPF